MSKFDCLQITEHPILKCFVRQTGGVLPRDYVTIILCMNKLVTIQISSWARFKVKRGIYADVLK